MQRRAGQRRLLPVCLCAPSPRHVLHRGVELVHGAQELLLVEEEVEEVVVLVKVCSSHGSVGADGGFVCPRSPDGW